MRNTGSAIVAAAALAVSACGTAHATDWLQFGYDTLHSGFNRAENGYPTFRGNRVAYHYALPTAIDSAAVYLDGVATNSGTRNLLFAVARDGTLYALDASSTTLNIVWSKQPGGSGAVTTGSPAVDPNRLYVYAYALDGKVHKYQVADGTEVTSGGWPQVSTLKPQEEKGASSLSIATAQNGHTYLYSVADGYSDDANDYQGHLTAIDLGTGAQLVFNAQCSDLGIHFVAWGITGGAGQNDCPRIGGGNSGIWGRPGAVYDAGTDRLFITTGNGLFDPANNQGFGKDWGDTILALQADGGSAGAGAPFDSYTPPTYGSDNPQAGLQGYDADLGSTSLAVVPPPPGTSATYQHVGVQAGKDGCVRLVNLANLSGQGGPAHVGGELQAVNFPGGSNCATGQEGPAIKMQPAVWDNPADQSSWVYITTEQNGVAAYRLSVVAGKPVLPDPPTWTANVTFGTSPIVANGIVYLMSDTRLFAYDAASGVPAIADDSAWATAVINDSHWQSPIIVNGRVYLFDGYATAPAQLWVYELDGVFRNGFQ